MIQGVSHGTPPRKIVSNTATSITWDLPMVINPGDVWIIEEPTWPYSCDTTSFDNANPLAVATINLPTNNFLNQTLVIAGFTVDVNGNESLDGDAPIREDWVFGTQGTRTITADSTMLRTDGLVDADASSQSIVYTCLAFNLLPNRTFTVAQTGSAAGHTVTIQTASSDDMFDDGTTSLVLSNPGQSFTFRVHG